MPLKVTTKGFIELWRGNTKISSHSVETEAIERATADAEKTRATLYTLKYPNKEIDLSTLARVVAAPDVLPPTAPVITATTTSSSAVSVALTAISTDIQSSVASYALEYKRSVDSTWTVWNSALAAGQFPVTITGLTASTQYDTRCRATDSASNVGPYSQTSQATTQSAAGQAPVWTTVPTITFTQGTASSVSISSYATDPNGDALTITKNAVALPTGVTYNQTLQRYEYDGAGAVAGTNGHILTADDAGSDWAARSTAAGVVVANRLETTAIINSWLVNDATANHVSLDTTLKPSGAQGSLRFSVLNADGAASGSLSVPFGTSFGNGQTFWFSYRVYFQPDEAYQFWAPGNDPTGTSAKLSIASRDANGIAPTGSNQVNEFVVSQNYNAGMLSAYYQDGASTSIPLGLTLNTPCQNGDVVDQPNRTGAALLGVDPDSGAAWSACRQYRAQNYALHYSARSNGIDAGNVVPGLGDPWSNGFRTYPGEWLTITCAVNIGTFGTFSSRLRLYAARDGQAYSLLADMQNIRLGAGPNYNGLTLLPYTTARIAGGKKVSGRSGQLSSCFTIWNVGANATTGDGTLSYNASTQRFTWTPPGGSAGTPRGFNAANGMLAINLIGNTAANFINGEVTVASLPSSGVTTETITIANGRPDTKRNYADVIISTQPINAPGGFAPT